MPYELDPNKDLLKCGSCGLHTVHNAFNLGLDASERELADFFKWLHWLFHNTPARREDLTEVTSLYNFRIPINGSGSGTMTMSDLLDQLREE